MTFPFNTPYIKFAKALLYSTSTVYLRLLLLMSRGHFSIHCWRRPVHSNFHSISRRSIQSESKIVAKALGNVCRHQYLLFLGCLCPPSQPTHQSTCKRTPPASVHVISYKVIAQTERRPTGEKKRVESTSDPATEKWSTHNDLHYNSVSLLPERPTVSAAAEKGELNRLLLLLETCDKFWPLLCSYCCTLTCLNWW